MTDNSAEVWLSNGEHEHQLNDDSGSQDPNEWIFKLGGGTSSSSSTSTSTPGSAQTSLYTTASPLTAAPTSLADGLYNGFASHQSPKLPPVPQTASSSSGGPATSAYPLTANGGPVTNGNGKTALLSPAFCTLQNNHKMLNGFVPFLFYCEGIPATSYYTPYQMSPHPPTGLYRGTGSPSTIAAGQRIPQFSPSSYFTTWGATNPTAASSLSAPNDVHAVTIDPQLVSPATQSTVPYISQPPIYPSTIAPSSLHSAVTPPLYTPTIIPPPVPQQRPAPKPIAPTTTPNATNTTRTTTAAPATITKNGSRSTPTSTSASQTVASTSRPTKHTPSPESHLKQLLSSGAFESSPTGAARSLISALTKMGVDDVSPTLRKEILNTVRDNAAKEFYEAWARNAEGLEILQTWLVVAKKKKEGKKEVDETLMPLLHVLDRLPMEVEQLRGSKLGKLVKGITNDPPSSAAKDVATTILNRWLDLVASQKAASEADTPADKKRKATDAPNSKAPPAKKSSTTASSSTSASIKKELTVKAEPTKVGKTDNSFFTAPKKKPLPSFKKVVAPVKKEGSPSTTGNGNASSASAASIDSFQEAMNAMRGNTGVTAPTSTASPVTVGANASWNANSGASGSDAMDVDSPGPGGKPRDPLRKKKSVSFRPDSELEAVKWIDKATYDDDENEPWHTLGDARDLDRGEGHALHGQGFEELIDWYEPCEILIPDDIILELRGGESIEAGIQAEREATALIAVYITPKDVPESASDISPRLGEPPSGADSALTVAMLPGPEIAELASNLEATANNMMKETPPSLNELLAQIAPAASASGPLGSILPPTQPKAMMEGGWGQQNGHQQMMQQPNEQQQDVLQSFGVRNAADLNALLSSVPPEMLAQIQATHQQQQQQQQQGPGAGGFGGDQGNHNGFGGGYNDGPQNQYWNDAGPSGPRGDGGGGYDDWDNGGGRGYRGRGGRGFRGRGEGGGPRGRGRGRGGDKVLCNFWAKGYCRFGETCDFWHDPAYAGQQQKRR
ncbi:hypothetical protein DL93DRAFT_2233363 [Clavulina sp. PMI_390]|nr:hypothetical protein DL93DRAFT_2233363 [Clavulina sp. PMI_390]